MLHEWDAFRVLIVAAALAVLFHTLLPAAPVAAEPLPSALKLQASQHLDAATRAFKKAVQAFSILAQEIAAIPDARRREVVEKALVDALNNIADSREEMTAAYVLFNEGMGALEEVTGALHQQVLDYVETCEAAKR